MAVGADPAEPLLALLRHRGAVPTLAWHTMARVPSSYPVYSSVGLAAPILLPILDGVLLPLAGVFIAQYPSWTTPGALVVQGVHGRYPLLLAEFVPAAVT